MLSKRKDIEELFFNHHSRTWKFKEIQEKINIADNKLSNWLKLLEKENIIKKIKEKNKHPYYKANFEAEEFKNAKKQYAINLLYNSGLINHITKNKEIHLAILFGSMVRSDWHHQSDIDLFFWGNENSFNEQRFKEKLKREFQIFSYKKPNFSKNISKELIKNIAQGFVIKGNLLDLLEDGKATKRLQRMQKKFSNH